MRFDRYSLIGWLPEKPDSTDLYTWFFSNVPETFELYDMFSDPGQSNDLSGKQPERVMEMSVKMIELFTEMRDEGRSNL